MTKLDCDGCGAHIDPLQDSYVKNPYYDQQFCEACSPRVKEYLETGFAEAWKDIQLETRSRLRKVAMKFFREKTPLEVVKK